MPPHAARSWWTLREAEAADLGFSETSLVWVINACMLTFGGCLLLGGRLGDLYGHRKMFLGGITLFALASLACGMANSQFLLACARAVQGLGGALGLAVLASLAAARSDAVQACASAAAALNSGYHVAFWFGAIFAAAAGGVGGVLLRPGQDGGADAQPGIDSEGVTAARAVPATGNAAATEHS